MWDLNVLDALEPAATLGSTKDSSPDANLEGHTEAVMALSWNRLQRNVKKRPVTFALMQHSFILPCSNLTYHMTYLSFIHQTRSLDRRLRHDKLALHDGRT